MDIEFTPAGEMHVPALTAIFNYYIESSTALFATEPIAEADMRRMLFFPDPRHRAFAIYADGGLAGFVSAHEYRPRGAFRNTAEVTIYLEPEFCGLGLGRLALERIETHARQNGLHALLASVCAENAVSLRLFERAGYFEAARFRELGYKFGRWLDTVWLEKLLEEMNETI